MALAGNANLSMGETTCVKSPNLWIGETASDLDLCGKRKGGNEIQGAMMAKAKESSPSRQVSEFTDFDGLLENFKDGFTFEEENFDLMRECLESNDTDLIAEMKEGPPYDHQAVLKYIAQVRNSGGFDLDVKLPTYLGSLLVVLIPLDLSKDKNEFPGDSDPDDANHQIPTVREYAYQRARFAIDEINVDMNAKTFELVEVVRAVKTACGGFFMFLTLAVKKVGEAEEEAATITIQAIVLHDLGKPMELKEWRFKPDAQA
ncbi:hypothetical protein SASPL_134857 [Salvia splendens]|uniref:Uncharacterized protein n=1 Tax=Salvia splendens TaxID=180675 RepID=A0A8X8WX37_SALSN|nr:uncharacterized protein LOC121760085 [Salvia splendens]KAG6402655.1 hypothetical protein SASPL_134857 [Salvia splendens]